MAATLYLLHCGWLNETATDGSIRPIPVPCYLIATANGQHILVDTGNPAALVGAANCGHWYHATCTITPEDDPIARLATLGLQPSDIDAIVATHFDFDHCGRYDAFVGPAPTVYVQRVQMGAALSDSDRYDPTLWRLPGLRWHLLDGDTVIDPDVTLLRTDGHAVGHQSLLVQTQSGPVILAVDAIDSQQMLESRSFPDYYDAEATNRSVDRLVALAKELDAPITFGHDPEQWATLPLAPDPYSRS
ncbi:MAG TPA: N-acyl homoserine lactonase family protein [Thermomicrobiales bacterium]|nr:N-acyl homoserine lactonase family protein [Thermomicrobiales bacterium]